MINTFLYCVAVMILCQFCVANSIYEPTTEILIDLQTNNPVEVTSNESECTNVKVTHVFLHINNSCF